MKPLISYLLAALVAGALLFGWGYRRGAASVTVRDSVSVQLKPMPPVTVTIREPWPVAVHEPADTVWQTIPADTGAIIADYLLYYIFFGDKQISQGMYKQQAEKEIARMIEGLYA